MKLSKNDVTKLSASGCTRRDKIIIFRKHLIKAMKVSGLNEQALADRMAEYNRVTYGKSSFPVSHIHKYLSNGALPELETVLSFVAVFGKRWSYLLDIVDYTAAKRAVYKLKEEPELTKPVIVKPPKVNKPVVKPTTQDKDPTGTKYLAMFLAAERAITSQLEALNMLIEYHKHHCTSDPMFTLVQGALADQVATAKRDQAALSALNMK